MELGIIASKSPSKVDWAIIPDIPEASILNKYMNINSQMDEWEDVIENDVVINMQDKMDKTAAQQTTLQTTIMCVIFSFSIYYNAFSGCKKCYIPCS
jgi:hypothetical protein